MTWEKRLTFEVELATRLVYDTFNRTPVVGGFGTTTSGHTYIDTGIFADCNTTGTVGTIQPSVLNNSRLVPVDVGAADQSAVATFSLNALPASGSFQFGPMVRYADGNNYYWAEVAAVVPGVTGTLFRITMRYLGAFTILAARSRPVAAGTRYGMRLEVSGQRLRARLWDASTTEPGTWDLEVDNNDMATATSAGLFARNDTASTSHVLTVDDLAVSTPPTFVDLSSRVLDELTPIEWAITGRQNNLDQAEPGNLSVLLNNSDGALTFGNTASPYYPSWGPACRCRQRERIGTYAYDHFSGYLQVPDEILSLEGVDHQVRVTAVDRLARLEATRTFVSTLTEHIRFYGGTALKAFWPLSDAAAPFSSISGAAYPTAIENYALNFGIPTATSGTAQVVPASQVGPAGDDVSYADFNVRVDTVGGLLRPVQSVLNHAVIPAGSISVGYGQVLTVVAWINSDWPAPDSESDPLQIRFTDSGTGAITLVRQDGTNTTWLVDVSGTTPLSASFIGPIAPYVRWTQVAIRFACNPTNLIELWVDGVQTVGTLSGVSLSTPIITDAFMPYRSFDGAMACVQVYVGAATDWTFTEFTAQRGVALSGYERQTTGDRVRLAATFGGIPASALSQVDPGTAVMGAARLAGKNPTAVMREAEATERGLLSVDGSGNLRFFDRRRLYNI